MNFQGLRILAVRMIGKEGKKKAQKTKQNPSIRER